MFRCKLIHLKSQNSGTMSEVNILETGSKALYFFQRRWYVILLCVVVGVFFSYYKQSKIDETTKCYETKLLGETESASNYLAINLITNLSPSVSEKNIPYLMEELRISKKTASSLQELDAEIYVVKNEFDQVNNNVFKIHLVVSDLSEMDNIRLAFDNYINEDPLFKGKGKVVISPKYTKPMTPVSVKGQINYVKYIVVFLTLGLVLALAIDFFFSILKYRKSN